MISSTSKLPNIIITADSLQELNNLMADMVNQGWTSDGQPVENEDGTYSVIMVRSRV